MVTRDSLPRGGRRDPESLRRWLVAYASAVGTVTDQRGIYTAAGVAKATGEAYANLMKALYIAEPVPAWWTNELKRLAKRPKLHLIDCALLRPLSGLNVDGTLRDGSFGTILESFVVGQLRALASVAKISTRLYHLRQFDDREVDIVLERADRRLVAIEVKATSTPSSRDAKDLRWLRDQWGERVVAAIVAHTGPAAFDLGDGVVACPIGTLLGL